MDSNNDGELSRLEMVRAFRLDERVRELMLPLLPMPSVSKNSITGVDLQEQIDAFETMYQVMDSDGSDGVSLEEFEQFFRLMDVKKKGRSKGLIDARKRLLAPKIDHQAEALANGQSLGSPRGGSPRGSPRRPNTSGVTQPRLDGLMRKNYLDTWRKPMVLQMPRPVGGVNGLQPHRSQASLRRLPQLSHSRESLSRASVHDLVKGERLAPGSRETPHPARKKTPVGPPKLTSVGSTAVTASAAAPLNKGALGTSASMPELSKTRSVFDAPPNRMKVAAAKLGLVRQPTEVVSREAAVRTPSRDPWRPRVNYIELAQRSLEMDPNDELEPFEKVRVLGREQTCLSSSRWLLTQSVVMARLPR
jgi:hypothetical protein